MCGICGFTGNDFSDDKNTVINLMAKQINHRGPDGEGFYIDDKVTLGFKRLSFLDLTEGSQPMFNEDKTLVIVFNGEIYNFKHLREMLINKGHTFSTFSDTEVIIHLYEEYKEEAVNYLRGMFAFVIYDINTGKIFAARDFFGIKPFYYSKINGNFVFASEIKAITQYPPFKKEVNIDALTNYLTFQYSVLNETFFKGVFKLPPGHYLTYENGNINITKYFNITFKPTQNDLKTTIKKIDNVITNSINYHNVSDVEIGSFLSSGVDSSLITSRFGGNKTFTVGFDYEEYNEIGYAKALSDSLGIKNINKIITTEEYWGSISKIQYHMDEPLADPSAIALYFVSQIAKDHVKGVLSGEGADEIFGGYNIYKEPLSLAPMKILPHSLLKILKYIVSTIPFNFKGKNYIIRASQTVQERFIGNAKIFTEKERSKILKNIGNTKVNDITGVIYKNSQKYDTITKMQHLDMHLWLVGDILLKADKMSMAHSLEVRVPYLDKEVFKVANSLPTKYRVNKKSTKYAFRLSAKKYLHNNIANKKKLGFPVPIRIWLKEEKYYNIVNNSFLSESANKFFNTKQLIKLLDEHKIGKKDNSRKIWTVYMFLVWYAQYFE